MGYGTNISYFSINMKEKERTERVMKQNKVFFSSLPFNLTKMLLFFLKLYRPTTGNMTRRGDREKTSSCCVLRMETHWKPPGGSVMESAFYRAPSTLYRETASPSDKPHGLILGDMSVFLKTHWDLLGMSSTWALEVVSYRNILFFIVLLCFE